jgi:hypothetical protein
LGRKGRALDFSTARLVLVRAVVGGKRFHPKSEIIKGMEKHDNKILVTYH